MFGGMELQHRADSCELQRYLLHARENPPWPPQTTCQLGGWSICGRSLAGIYGYTERTWGADGISHLAIV